MSAIVVQRMVEETDFPGSFRVLQVLVKPVELLRIHVIAVQSKESNRAFPESIVSLAAHVKRLVETFVIGIIMIPQRGVELHAGVKQGLIGFFKLLRKIPGGMAAINVVAEHDHEIKLHGLPVGLHLTRHFILIAVTCAAVSDNGKPHGVLQQRQPYIQTASGTRRALIAGGLLSCIRMQRKRCALSLRSGNADRPNCGNKNQSGSCHFLFTSPGIASGSRSTIKSAPVSYSTSVCPTSLYCNSLGKRGRFKRRVGGVDCNGRLGGYF